MKQQRYFYASIILLATLSVSAQQGVQPPAPGSADTVPVSRFPAEWYPTTPSGLKIQPGVQGLPYVASLVVIGYDPSDPKHEMRFQQMRDSQGRSRNENYNPYDLDASGKLANSKIVGVWDPIARCSFSWIEGSPTQPKVATVQCMAPQDQFGNESMPGAAALERGGCPGRFEGLDKTATCEALGEQKVGGIPAIGRKETLKEEPPYVEEYWWSPELKIAMELKITRGTVLLLWTLQNVQRIEPEPAKFYPPADYRIEKK